jgi:dTMP kinase
MEHQGKLIVIEGVDGSGKETQSRQLYDHLRDDGIRTMLISFPRYDQDSSAMVRRYLAGEFGTDPEAVSPYIASTFYAADRYAAYKQEFGAFLEGGGVVIADRYTTANMVHQAGKIRDAQEREAFLNWLTDYEFGLLGLPEPDLVFFLDVPPDESQILMEDRANKMTGDMEKDIHEDDAGYLATAYANARRLARDRGWTHVVCTDEEGMRSIASIHQEIYERTIRCCHETP